MGKKFVVTNERLIVSPFHLNATYVRFACIRTILAYVASVTRMGGGGRRGASGRYSVGIFKRILGHGRRGIHRDFSARVRSRGKPKN